MSSSKFLAYIGGAGALTYGAYFAVQQKEVLKYEKEASDLAKLLDKEKAKATSTAKLITENEQKAEKLAAEEAAFRTQLTKAHERLEAAQKEVSKLQKEVDSVTNSRTSVLARLSALRSDSERVKEALTLGEKSLQVARQKAADAKALLNPLNHPSIKGKK